MGINHQGKIITDGLFLKVDVANPKSYPGTGTTWNDLSGKGNNGTLTNGPTYSSNNNGIMVFDGVDDNTTIQYNIPLTLSIGGTFDVWLKPSSFSGNRVVFNCTNNTTTMLYLGTSIELPYKCFRPHILTNNGLFYGSVIFSATENIWYNFVYTYNTSTSTMICYINGQTYSMQWTNAPTVGSILSSYTTSQTFYIGKDDRGTSTYSGSIGCLNIYNRALSASEIQQNFQALRGRYGI